jgi:hypothetical protein
VELENVASSVTLAITHHSVGSRNKLPIQKSVLYDQVVGEDGECYASTGFTLLLVVAINW